MNGRTSDPVPVGYIDMAFESFADVEVSSWPAELNKDRRLLVKPSGTMSANLVVNLNYPPMTATQQYNGEMFDPANRCIQLVTKWGMDVDNTLWVDTLTRRTSIRNSGTTQRFSISNDTPTNVLNIHVEFVSLLHSQSHAKVILMGGKESQTIFSQFWGERLVEVPLDVDDPGKNVHILYESTVREKIQCIVIFIYHPEYLLRAGSVDRIWHSHCVLTDSRVAMALSMVGINQGPMQRHASALQCQRALEHRGRPLANVSPLPEGFGEISEDVVQGILRATTSALMAEQEEDKQEKDIINRTSAPAPKAKEMFQAVSGRLLQIFCDNCNAEKTDPNPLFWKKDMRFYRVTRLQCQRCYNNEKDKNAKSRGKYIFRPHDGTLWVQACFHSRTVEEAEKAFNNWVNNGKKRVMRNNRVPRTKKP